MVTSLHTWHDELTSAIAVLRSAGRALTPPPSYTGPPSEQLPLLLDVLRAVEFRGAEQRPEAMAAQRLAGSATAPHASDSIRQGAAELLAAIGQTINRLLPELTARELFDSGLIRTADFGANGTRLLNMSPTGAVMIYAGLLRCLPADHPLNTDPPEGWGWYRVNGPGTEPALLLGSPTATVGGPVTPRAWYLLNDALALTRTHANDKRPT